MKWLGGGGDGVPAASGRSQDDAAVGYVFQRTAQDPQEFQQQQQQIQQPAAPVPQQAVAYSKQPRWALADEPIIDVS